MLVSILDFETTSLDVNEGEITEVGCILWDSKHDSVIEMYSSLVLVENEIPERIVELTGITTELLRERGNCKEQVFPKVIDIVETADVICAHHAQFERSYYKKHINEDVSAHWIDTKTDLPPYAYGKSTSLTYLAADHGFLNPFPHRALPDCMTTLKILQQYDLEEVLEISKSPELRVIADVSYDDRQLAKNEYFAWDGEKKQWYKMIRKCHLKDKTFPFRVYID